MEKIVVTVLGAFLLILVCATFTGVFVMWLWDFAVTAVFGLPEIRFVHAWALTALCGILFNTRVSTK